MAEQLETEVLISLTNGAGTNHAEAEWRNDSSKIIHIRSIEFTGRMATASVTDALVAQLNKQSTMDDAVQNSNVWQVNDVMQLAGTFAQGMGSLINATRRLYAKGQVILKPNQSMRLHTITVGSIGSLLAKYVIGWHF